MTATEPLTGEASHVPRAAQYAPRATGASAASTGFAAELRTATNTDHSSAEGGEFLRALFDGTFRRSDYVALAIAHLAIYGALESAADVLRQDPVAGPFVDRRLYRRDRLRADLAVLAQDGPTPTPGPAVLAYRDRIVAACEQNPALFVAHHYTRYLGDLSGGLMIHRRLVRELPELGNASSFYDFAALGDLAEFKSAYRIRLDEAPLSRADRLAVIYEVRTAYRHNVDVFIELHRLRDAAGR